MNIFVTGLLAIGLLIQGPSGDRPHNQANSEPGSQPGGHSGGQPDNRPDSRPDSRPGSRPGSRPESQQTQADAAPRPKIVGVAHIAFRVSAMPAAQAFYGDVLGLAVMRSGASAPDARLRFRVNDRQDILIEPGLPPTEDERLSHLAFETMDLAALATYLKARGIEVSATAPPPTRPCAAHALWVKDPDGHPIEFVERAGLGATGAARAAGGTASGASIAAPVAPPSARRATMTREAPISARVLHAGLTIRDAAAADAFYKTVLGFSEIWRGGRTDDVVSWINMKVPDGTDYLEYMLATGPVTRQNLGSMHHVALLVPSIQDAYETALRRTPAATRGALASPQVGRNRRWQLNLFDPDGSRVELMEPYTMR